MRRIKRSEEGQAMVEFALVAPLLFLILFGIIQFGIAFMHSVALTDAVRAGARKAAVSRSAADPTLATKNAVLGAATDLDTSQLSSRITVTSDWVSGDTVTVDATYPYQINLLGIVVASGNLHSSTTERVE
jgi:Flp pilus assembly protein TadG